MVVGSSLGVEGKKIRVISIQRTRRNPRRRRFCRIPHTFFNNPGRDVPSPLLPPSSLHSARRRPRERRIGRSVISRKHETDFCRDASGLKIRHYRSTARSCATSESMKRLHIAALATETSPCNIAERWLRCLIACLAAAGWCSRVAANSRACSHVGGIELK